MDRKVVTLNPGEQVLMETTVNGVLIRRLPDDPICPRISLGGEPDATYFVYRGDPHAIRALLVHALAAFDARIA